MKDEVYNIRVYDKDTRKKVHESRAEGFKSAIRAASALRPKYGFAEYRIEIDPVRTVRVAGMPPARKKARHLHYVIDLDERGEFRADVRHGTKTIFEIDGFEIFEDGFMKDQTDLVGLLHYLIDLGIAQEGDSLEYWK